MKNDRVMVIHLAVKFRWLITWFVYEKEIVLDLPFATPYTGQIGAFKDKGVYISIWIKEDKSATGG